MEVRVSRAGLRRLLVAATALIALLGLGAELHHHVGAHRESALVTMLSLSEEANLPTWYSSLLLFACAVALAAIAAGARRSRDRFARRWGLLALIFVYLSIDEATQIHERLDFLELRGLFHFSWVVPAGVVVALVGVYYLPFLRHLPSRTRRWFVIAGALYVGGALLMELPLGWWTERAGDDNLGYALIDFIEETLEMIGAATFLAALVDHLADGRAELCLTPGER